MANGIIHSFTPTTYNDNQPVTSSGPVTKEYTVTGTGWLIVSASLQADNTSDTGTQLGEIMLNGDIVAYNSNRLGVAGSMTVGVSVSAGIAVTAGDKIRLILQSSKNGTKYIYRHFLCFGCAVSAS